MGDLTRLRTQEPGLPERPAARVIAPPAVNAHTHLDLSDMPLTPGSYTAFIPAVIAHNRAGRRGLAAAKRGLAMLRAEGVDTFGDIVTDEETLAWLLEQPGLSGVAYWEVLGLDPERADEVFEQTLAVIERHRGRQRPDGLRLGLSPHTPHTVSAPLLSRLARLAKEQALPMQIHVGEDPGERELHLRGTGPLADAMGPFLQHFRPSGMGPVAYLDQLGVLEAAPTLVHAVHVDEEEVRLLQRAGCVVVHCPRSNALLECGLFPWALYARHGVTVALGTDSLGSSPSLSVVDEWSAAAALHGSAADPAQLLWAAVKGGHRALGTPVPRVVRGSPADAVAPWPEARPWPGTVGDVKRPSA